ncbi:MAG: hypothetical protein CVV03_05190 [Firmicutes bacterium HGW-Firmicutes-8]|nr:MAG: hypothetical protein CVV03_05190 [Firmicutes bacterium HGW-Firmicutes-8]
MDMSESYIFALDIGTRSVVGVVMHETPKGLEIVASEHLEHQNRAMIDGQIHDIEQVAKAIKVVKEKLETKIGQTLTQVAVAAAGRALRTVRLKMNNDIVEYKEIHRDDILRLELQAVQEAQNKLAESDHHEDDSLNYHCVGYSVVNYELDGFRIGNLYGQKGKNMSAEVIATFLPRVVVDSLFAALQRVKLEMTSLTLEPIAASAVVVPPSMRQLNIALLDIGAGTSDIAITDDGSIVGYGMVPIAGDEVTEKISQEYLVDFNQAEIIKRSIYNHDEIKFADVLGIEQAVPKEDVLEVICETVQYLAKQISERLIELNGRTPQAVICIGGGSLTPLLKDMLAENLGLSKQRVAIRGREAIAEVFGAQELMGPEAVTPIGIAVTSFEHKGLGFAWVIVNNRQVRLFERGTVADALLAAGVSIRRTMPRLGMALTVTVNEELKIIKGGRGKPAIVKLNGHDVTIDTPVKHNDVIEFVEAIDGENAKGYIYDVVQDILPISISINEESLTINHVITMNGQAVTFYDELVDNARIVHYLPRTIADVLEIAGYSDAENEYDIYVNEHIVDPMTEISDGDVITIETKNEPSLIEISSEDGDGQLDLMEEQYVQSALEVAAADEESESGVITLVYVNQERVEIPRSDVILTDILTRINFSLQPPEPGMRLEMKVNSLPAEFTTPLRNGDNVNLEWI